MTELILIRHGQTEWNRNKRYCGFTDIPLNCQGKKQAARLKGALDDRRIDKIYSSDLSRAIETAGIIFPSRRIEQLKDLREMCFGVFEGLNHGQILKKYPAVYSRWLKEPYSVKIPDAESLSGFSGRITKALNNLIFVNPNKSLAVVCHGGTISAFINKVLKAKEFWKYIPGSATMSVVEYDGRNLKIKLFDHGQDHFHTGRGKKR